MLPEPPSRAQFQKPHHEVSPFWVVVAIAIIGVLAVWAILSFPFFGQEEQAERESRAPSAEDKQRALESVRGGPPPTESEKERAFQSLSGGTPPTTEEKQRALESLSN